MSPPPCRKNNLTVRWNNKTSMVTPDEEIFYLVAFLSPAIPSLDRKIWVSIHSKPKQKNLDFCDTRLLG
ncbi:hypothetical protein RHSIM_Rhsim07G0135400 [Rhododendron simsii]|uniref:Cytokinin dehydrogenase 1 FAD/cytokinin binding domain-containing protein n=1 Tax=Rhododendron simsii TaxID=118357 RepID=A0A834GU52_RHOSS|nr:hypothetical protein RHSIM_Rhsim07G0135400 [Rhododendron simsii]